MRRTLLGALALTTLPACNAYDYFLLTGFQQEGFSNKADIVFVIDNSPSMVDEADALASNFSDFIAAFADDANPPSNPSLSDDVGRFLEYVTDRTGNVNFQLGITTTEVSADAGLLLGANPILAKTDKNVPTKFNENLVCEAACITRAPSVDVECPPLTNWGTQNCADSQTGASEEGIEAVYMAMCRAVDNPPETCFQQWWLDPTNSRFQPSPPSLDSGDSDGPIDTDLLMAADYFDDEDVGTNGGWLRENSVVIPVIVTDEGDQSRRINGRQGDVFPYPELFREFGHRMAWAVIGPNLDCNTAGAAEWGVTRYRTLVESSNGRYVEIARASGADNCVTADFGEALTKIGELLRGLADTFPLRAQPVPGTIVVEVNGRFIPEAEGRFDEDLQAVVYDDGWVYVPGDNAVVLKGDAVPDFNADVRVWYLPSQGVPRELPF